MAFRPSARFVRVVRIVASATMLLISALMLILWIRNFWHSDVIWAPLPNAGHFLVASVQGQAEIAINLPSRVAVPFGSPRQTAPRWGAESYSIASPRLSEVLLPQVKPIRYRRLSNGHELNVMAPYWCLVPLTWILAAAPWIRWSKRFSLRAFMIATAVVAVAMGIAVTSKW